MKLLTAVLLAFCATLGAQTPPPPGVHYVDSRWTAPIPVMVGGVTIQITGYNVYRGLATGVYSKVANVPSAATTNYSDVSGTGNVLTEGATYFYAVTATAAGGAESTYSNEASATIPFLPSRPTGLSSTAH